MVQFVLSDAMMDSVFRASSSSPSAVRITVVLSPIF